jgi:serine/threonine protein kinase
MSEIKKFEFGERAYLAETKIGKGRFGQVWSARDATKADRYAVKVVDMLNRERLRTEYDALSKIEKYDQYRLVVRAYGLGRADNGNPAMLMELVEGKPLAHLVASLKEGNVRWTLGEELNRVRIATQIIRALFDAYRAGIVLHDIKLNNFYYYDQENWPRIVRVIDWNLVDVASANEFQESSVALGSVLAELFTGNTIEVVPGSGKFDPKRLGQEKKSIPPYWQHLTHGTRRLLYEIVNKVYVTDKPANELWRKWQNHLEFLNLLNNTAKVDRKNDALSILKTDLITQIEENKNIDELLSMFDVLQMPGYIDLSIDEKNTLEIRHFEVLNHYFIEKLREQKFSEVLQELQRARKTWPCRLRLTFWQVFGLIGVEFKKQSDEKLFSTQFRVYIRSINTVWVRRNYPEVLNLIDTIIDRANDVYPQRTIIKDQSRENTEEFSILDDPRWPIELTNLLKIQREVTEIAGLGQRIEDGLIAGKNVYAQARKLSKLLSVTTEQCNRFLQKDPEIKPNLLPDDNNIIPLRLLIDLARDDDDNRKILQAQKKTSWSKLSSSSEQSWSNPELKRIAGNVLDRIDAVTGLQEQKEETIPLKESLSEQVESVSALSLEIDRLDQQRLKIDKLLRSINRDIKRFEEQLLDQKYTAEQQNLVDYLASMAHLSEKAHDDVQASFRNLQQLSNEISKGIPETNPDIENLDKLEQFLFKSFDEGQAFSLSEIEEYLQAAPFLSPKLKTQFSILKSANFFPDPVFPKNLISIWKQIFVPGGTQELRFRIEAYRMLILMLQEFVDTKKQKVSKLGNDSADIVDNIEKNLANFRKLSLELEQFLKDFSLYEELKQYLLGYFVFPVEINDLNRRLPSILPPRLLQQYCELSNLSDPVSIRELMGRWEETFPTVIVKQNHNKKQTLLDNINALENITYLVQKQSKNIQNALLSNDNKLLNQLSKNVEQVRCSQGFSQEIMRILNDLDQNIANTLTARQKNLPLFDRIKIGLEYLQEKAEDFTEIVESLEDNLLQDSSAYQEGEISQKKSHHDPQRSSKEEFISQPSETDLPQTSEESSGKTFSSLAERVTIIEKAISDGLDKLGNYLDGKRSTLSILKQEKIATLNKDVGDIVDTLERIDTVINGKATEEGEEKQLSLDKKIELLENELGQKDEENDQYKQTSIRGRLAELEALTAASVLKEGADQDTKPKSLFSRLHVIKGQLDEEQEDTLASEVVYLEKILLPPTKQSSKGPKKTDLEPQPDTKKQIVGYDHGSGAPTVPIGVVKKEEVGNLHQKVEALENYCHQLIQAVYMQEPAGAEDADSQESSTIIGQETPSFQEEVPLEKKVFLLTTKLNQLEQKIIQEEERTINFNKKVEVLEGDIPEFRNWFQRHILSRFLSKKSNRESETRTADSETEEKTEPVDPDEPLSGHRRWISSRYFKYAVGLILVFGVLAGFIAFGGNYFDIPELALRSKTPTSTIQRNLTATRVAIKPPTKTPSPTSISTLTYTPTAIPTQIAYNSIELNLKGNVDLEYGEELDGTIVFSGQWIFRDQDSDAQKIETVDSVDSESISSENNKNILVSMPLEIPLPEGIKISSDAIFDGSFDVTGAASLNESVHLTGTIKEEKTLLLDGKDNLEGTINWKEVNFPTQTAIYDSTTEPYILPGRYPSPLVVIAKGDSVEAFAITEYSGYQYVLVRKVLEDDENNSSFVWVYKNRLRDGDDLNLPDIETCYVKSSDLTIYDPETEDDFPVDKSETLIILYEDNREIMVRTAFDQYGWFPKDQCIRE